jgi:predicted metalloendopeptidase
VLANAIFENMDPDVDLCEDFHSFSCGSFIKTKRIPDEQTKTDVFDMLRLNLGFQITGNSFFFNF